MSISSDELVITGMGMVSSLGLTVVQSCAAARAGISRSMELDYCVEVPAELEMIPVMGHSVGYFTLGFSELGRLVRLGSLALKDLIGGGRIDIRVIENTAIIINLASGYYLEYAAELRNDKDIKAENEEGVFGLPNDELMQWYKSELIKKILHVLNISIEPRFQKVIFEDQPGIVHALMEAKELLLSGKVEYCIVGGIDSLIDYVWLDALNDLGLLKTAVSSSGFMPGEGAGFFLIETYKHAKQRNAKVLAIMKGLSLKQDSTHRFTGEPSNGIVLSEVISDTLDKASTAPCFSFICHLNGDPIRAQEWGNTLTRLQRHLSNIKENIIPADSFGETGAAYGFMASCLGIHSFVRGYHKSDSSLVWISSDKGKKGSFLIVCDH